MPERQMHSMRIEMEADGLPAQVALKNRAPYPDDPTEPWSPNYGTVAPSLPVERAPLAEPAPPRFDSARVARQIASAPAAAFQPSNGRQLDPDDIIRRAIAEHEMRRN